MTNSIPFRLDAKTPVRAVRNVVHHPTRSVGLTSQYTQRTPCVYDTCMSKVRTNIEIEDSYLQLVMDRYHLRTKTEAVDLALRHLAGNPMSREEALAMRGSRSIGKAPSDSRPRGA